MTIFSERLTKAREKKGISKKELAKYMGLDYTTICKYETGVNTPQNKEILKKLADYLGVSIDYLLGQTDNPRPNFGRESEFLEDLDVFFLRSLKGLTPEGKKKVYEFIEMVETIEKTRKEKNKEK